MNRTDPKPNSAAGDGGGLGLYVHVPFCVARCRYCAFASSVYDAARAGRYLAALEREAAGIRLSAFGLRNEGCAQSPEPKAQSRSFSTLYVGGGTPTVLSVGQLERLAAVPPVAEALRSAAERTVEANPGTVDDDKFRALRRLGFDRLSLGAQSFDDGELALLGRVHRASDVADAVAGARRAGFANLGLDLIFGLPGQSEAGFRASLEAALELAPEHVSLYGLTYEPGTPLAEEIKVSDTVFSPCDEEVERAMYLAAVERLASAGYRHYEVANFALPGRESRHNLNYWAGGEYLGLGAGAASYLAGERSANVGDVEEYCARIEAGRTPTESAERLEPEARAREALMLALRMTAGVDLEAFRLRTGFDAPALFGPTLEGHLAAGRAELSDGRLRLTLDGLLVANSIMSEFI